MKNQGEVLTQAEIEALLASLPGTEGGPVESSAPKGSARPVRSWDFRKPDKFSKDHMRSLLALHQNLSRLAATGLAARLRTGVTIKVTSVDQALYEEYIDLLPSVSVLNVVSLRPLAGNMLFEMQPELAMMMIDRLLGGIGGPADPNHEMTDIELALVRNLGRTVLEALREAWLNLSEIDPHIEEVATSPRLVQVASPRDIVVIVLLEVQVGDRLGTMSLCLPHLVLEPLMHRLSAQVWVVDNRRRTPTTEMRGQLLNGLNRAPLKVTAVLGETAISVNDVLHLQEGDVLLLGSGSVRNVRLNVADQHKFFGAPGLVGGRLAVQVTRVEGEDQYGD